MSTVTSEMIFKLRNERKMSQTDLAKSAGISRTTLNKVESGGDVSIATLNAIATAFDCRLEIKLSPIADVSIKTQHPRYKIIAAGLGEIEWLVDQAITDGWELAGSLIVVVVPPSCATAGECTNSSETIYENDGELPELWAYQSVIKR